MTTNTIGRTHPHFTPKRPAAQQAPTLPKDEVSWRPETSTLTFGAKALAVGALGLSAFGCVGSAPPPQQVQEMPEVRPVSRHSAPISGEQRSRLEELSEARATDNGTASGVRSNYRHLVERFKAEANQYQNLSEQLESEGQRLQTLAEELGPGAHQTETGTVTVDRSERGQTVTEESNGNTTTLRSYGDSWTVEFNNGRRTQTLEDSQDARTVTDGMFTRTLHLTDSALHRAGEFEIQQVTRSWSDSVTLNGTTIRRSLDRQVPDPQHGRAREKLTEVFEEPQVASLVEGGPQLVFRENSTKRNLFTDQVTESSREVEVRGDGSTRSGGTEQPGRRPANNPTSLPQL